METVLARGKETGWRRVLTVTPELCTGCRTCELACSLAKAGELNVWKARLRLRTGRSIGTFEPTVCRHCSNPSCLAACPFPGAMFLDERTGAVVISEEKCTGCRVCLEACPFGAIYLDPDGNLLKCDLCGGDPVCVRYCPTRPADSLPHLSHPEQSCLQYKAFHEVGKPLRRVKEE